LRLPIKLSRKLPRRPLRCLPIIPHHQPTPLTPAITSTAAKAVPYPAPAPNSLRKSLSPYPQLHRHQLHKSRQNQTSTRPSKPHQARVQAKPQPKPHPNPQTHPKQKKLPGKTAYHCKLAHNRLAAAMGLDHRSITIGFFRATPPPGRRNASDAALTAAAAFVLSSVFRMTRTTEILWGA
jgi:hypothetical protein